MHTASKYLRRVARLTGAKQVHSGSCWLSTERKNFIDDKFVCVVSHRCKSTCFSVATDPDIPSADEAVNYKLGQREALTVFTTDGAVPIDNNVSEREMKRVVLNRKNSLFVGEVGPDDVDLHLSTA